VDSPQIPWSTASRKEHIELVYENQVEDYTADHLKKNEYLEP
jgi:hypothetical protein